MTEFQYELDARGEKCPSPVKKTKQILNQMDHDDVVHVMTTDPASEHDLSILLKAVDDEMLESSNEDGVFHYYIKKR